MEYSSSYPTGERALQKRTRIRIAVIVVYCVVLSAACLDTEPRSFVIADSKKYEASLFRQHCAICHGTEGEGRTLDDGKVVPSLRTGEFKFRTEAEIYKQIADGGNGMTPFRGQLTERELQLMATFVRDELRGVR